MRVGGDVIYHGMFGTGLFQTIYRKPASMVAMMMMSIEWHLLGGVRDDPGAGVPAAAVGGAVHVRRRRSILAIIAAMQAPMPRHRHWLSRPLIAYLHFRQPIARGWARYSVRLKAKAHAARRRSGYRRAAQLPFDPHDRARCATGASSTTASPLLDKINDEVQDAGWRVRLDSGWDGWDMEVYGSRYVKVRLTTATEHHHGVGNADARARRAADEHVLHVVLHGRQRRSWPGCCLLHDCGRSAGRRC